VKEKQIKKLSCCLLYLAHSARSQISLSRCMITAAAPAPQQQHPTTGRDDYGSLFTAALFTGIMKKRLRAAGMAHMPRLPPRAE